VASTFTISSNVTLYAVWTADTYSVVYDGNTSDGGSTPASQTKTHAVNLTLRTNSGSLTKSGYSFGGWCTTQPAVGASCGGTAYAAGATYSANAAATLYAVWSDTIAPTVSSLSPDDDATSVAVGANLVVTFSESVNKVAGKYVRICTGTASCTGSSVVGDVVQVLEATSAAITVSSVQVTINPASDLSAGTTYYVSIDAGAFHDAAHNTFAGLSAGSSWNFTTAAALTCATGGTCIVGDIGPGGGKVFYDAGSLQSWGRYLEAAPANATSATWCNNTSTALSGTFSRAIGSGAMNTYLMLDGCTTGAAYNATGYSNNGYTDWFLPSILDLGQMCTNRATLGMTSAGTFKSSSQDTIGGNAGIHAETWNFPGAAGTCGNDNWGKSLTQGVRPIRAIGDSTAPSASVTSASISSSGSATIRSTEIGRGFLVNTSVTVSNLASITGAAGSLWNAITITAADFDTSLGATGLSAGTYKVYTIDQSGNLSAASSGTVTIS